MDDDDPPVHWKRDPRQTAKAIHCDVCRLCRWRNPGSMIDVHCTYGGPHESYQTPDGTVLGLNTQPCES